MGTNSNATGSIEINPPLSHAEVRRYNEWANFGGAGKRFRSEREVFVEIDRETEDLDTGTIITWSGYEIRPNAEDHQYKRYNTEEDLKELVEMFPDHEYTGYIEQESEGYGDDHEIFRLYVVNHAVMRVTPEIVWPS